MARGRSVRIRRVPVRAGKPSGTRAHLVTTIQGGDGEESSPISLSQSTIAADAWTITGNGSDTQSLTATWRYSNGEAATGRAVTWTVIRTLVDAAECTLTCLEAEIADDGTTPANFRLHVYNADGTPLPGIPASAISLASSRGASDTITEVDTETDQNGRFRFAAVSSTAGNPVFTATVKSIVVTQTATVEVTGDAPALPTLDWFSDFSHATGTSDAAVADGASVGTRKWPGAVTNNGNGLEVIASTGLDFPSTNVLRVTAKETGSGFLRILNSTLLTLPGENESIWYRVYLRHGQSFLDAPGSPDFDENNHPIELGFTGDEDVTLHTLALSETTWRVGNGMTAAANGFANSQWLSPVISHATTYRFEWQIARLTGVECNLHVRLYNSSNVLLYEDDDFYNRSEVQGGLSSNPTLYLEAVSNLAEICAGLNGIGGTYWYPSDLFNYQGCFAVSRDTWCGAYDAGNG